MLDGEVGVRVNLRGQVRRLLAVVVHVHAQARRVAHALLADLALQRALERVVLVADVHLQVVAVREEPVAGRALDAARLTVPACGLASCLMQRVQTT